MKRRRARIAVFMGVEDSVGGIGDLVIAYLKMRFRSETVSVKHKACDGGSYKDMTIRAKRAAANDDFDLRFLVWDADRIKHGNDMPEAEEDYELLLCEPCMEGEILSLKGTKPTTTKECKKLLGEIRHLEQMKRLLDSIPDARFMENERLKIIITAITTGTKLR